MKLNDYLNEMNETDMKYQALAMAKEIHSQLAELTFIEMLSAMSPENKAKKIVEELETKLNTLTTEVGQFIQDHIKDVADAEPGDVSDQKSEEDQDAKKDKENNKKISDKKEVKKDKEEKEIKESFRNYLHIYENKSYEIKDDKVFITKDNFKKQHKDYKNTKKDEESLLVLDPKTGITTIMPVKFID